MKQLANLTLLALALFAFGSCCTSDEEKEEKYDRPDFPAAKADMGNLKASGFTPAPNQSFKDDQNGMYVTALELAWAEIKAKAGPVSNIESDVLNAINELDVNPNALTKDECDIKVFVEDRKVRAYTYLKKSIPFIVPFEESIESLHFFDGDVAAFGTEGPHPAISILYYFDDNNFAIGLKTKDPNQEVFLMKKDHNLDIFLDSEFNYLVDQTVKFSNNETRAQIGQPDDWGKYVEDIDIVRIPYLNLSVSQAFPGVNGTTFTGKEGNYKMIEAYQQIDFSLGEKGLGQESKSIENYARVPIKNSIEFQKVLNFDSGFFLFLKRTDSPTPYFNMYIGNRELMTPFHEQEEVQ